MPFRRLWGVVAVAAMTLATTFVTPAVSAHPDGPRITARASDYTPNAGQAFVVRGHYTPGGSVAAGQVVRLQSYAAGGWTNIRGARVTTTGQGHYRMRVILFVQGVRDLRVMGTPSDGQRRSFHRFVVEVH